MPESVQIPAPSSCPFFSRGATAAFISAKLFANPVTQQDRSSTDDESFVSRPSDLDQRRSRLGPRGRALQAAGSSPLVG